MNVKEYISSGIVESYVMGLATESECREFEANCLQYSEIAEARAAFERTLEEQLLSDAPAVPGNLKDQVLEKIRTSTSEENTADLEEQSTPVRSMGLWRWVAAACLLLAAGAVYWAVTTSKKYDALQAENRKLEAQWQESVAQASEMQSDLDKLKHPMKTAALKSEDDRAYAIVYWDTVSTSRDVYLLINNMPQPASGKQYQLWALLNGQPIDLGMIEVRQQRLLYRMKNLQRAQAFAITLEPMGGSPAPTSKPIAVSNL